MLIKAMLENIGLNVTLVENGKEVVEKAINQDFEVILMDINMPIMNGLEATNSLRKHGISTPIIALTANTMQGKDQKCLAAGYNGFLTKPIQTETLIDKLGKYLTPSLKKTNTTD
jgi:CheY-like chemotaxis protein